MFPSRARRPPARSGGWHVAPADGMGERSTRDDAAALPDKVRRRGEEITSPTA